VQAVYQQPSCLAHSFCSTSDGSSTDLLAPCLQTDSGNRNTQWTSAWLNLDFGVETCFYNGIDAYSNTWLQFVFPFYIWVLVGLMIFVSHYSQSFANMLGNNPVPIFATLILLSYAKIPRTLIIVASFVILEHPEDHFIRWMWLNDANLDYLGGKHIPLFLVALLVFLLIFLPHTFLLLFGQWLHSSRPYHNFQYTLT